VFNGPSCPQREHQPHHHGQALVRGKEGNHIPPIITEANLLRKIKERSVEIEMLYNLFDENMM